MQFIVIVNALGVSNWQIKTFLLQDGDEGTQQTIGLIQQLVQKGITDPRIRRTATDVLIQYGVPSDGGMQEVSAIFDWITRNFYFRNDMVDREMLQPPDQMLQTRSGDCDDFVILLASLLGSVGYATRAVTIKSNPEDIATFSHIYLEALVGGEWVPLDAARDNPAIGRSPEFFYAAARWPLTEGAGQYLNHFLHSRGRLRGLGDNTTVDDLLQSIPSIETGAAQIVAASNQPVYPYGSVLQPGVTGTVNLPVNTSSNSLWMMLILGVGLLLVMKK